MAEEGSCTYLIRRLPWALILRTVSVLLFIVTGICSIVCIQQLAQQHRLESPAVSQEGRIRERHICRLLGSVGTLWREPGGAGVRRGGGKRGTESQAEEPAGAQTD